MKRIVNPFIKRRQTKFPETGFAICDPLAMAVALHPELVMKSTLRRATVETAGTHTRGSIETTSAQGIKWGATMALSRVGSRWVCRSGTDFIPISCIKATYVYYDTMYKYNTMTL